MSDYEYDPREGESLFLRLKSKGDKVTVRLASAPFREPKVWKIDNKAPLDPEKAIALSEGQWHTIYRDPDYTVSEVFHWKVIDRASGVAKIFTSTAGVYKTIKEYAQMDAWGDPQNYDLQIERTEEPGRGYYKVTALPNKDPLSQRQQELVEAINMEERLPAARPLSQKQVDYIPEMGEENAGEDQSTDTEPLPEEPKATPTKNTKPDDVVIEDIGDEPINLDDIPF